jgi:hypothetical protein
MIKKPEAGICCFRFFASVSSVSVYSSDCTKKIIDLGFDGKNGLRVGFCCQLPAQSGHFGAKLYVQFFPHSRGDILSFQDIPNLTVLLHESEGIGHGIGNI